MPDSVHEETIRPDSQLKKPIIHRWSVFVVAISLIGIYFLVPQLSQLKGTFTALHHATLVYVFLGLLMTILGFVCAAFTQWAAGNGKGSFAKIGILQLTGAFINHFLPFNLGSVSLTARYYKTLNLTSSRAVTVSIMPTIFGVITTILLVAVVSPITLAHVLRHEYKSWIAMWLIVIVCLVTIGVLLLIPALRKRLKLFLKEIVNGFKELQIWPQLPELIAGSLGLTFTWTLALLFAASAVHETITFVDAFTLYVTSSLVSTFAPTPGGLGATEAFLAVGLASIGLPVPDAVATTLIFRFVTFWIPIIPGILALNQVNGWSGRQKRSSHNHKQS